jgi:D-ribose pyranase
MWVEIYTTAFINLIDLMIQHGILNPHLLSLFARVRHTNTVVIADWAFPNFPGLEIIDLSVIKGLPTVLDLLAALQPTFKVGQIWQAEQFLTTNPPETIADFDEAFSSFQGAAVTRLEHNEFKKLVPNAIGLIRTGDPTAYGNVILQSV